MPTPTCKRRSRIEWSTQSNAADMSSMHSRVKRCKHAAMLSQSNDPFCRPTDSAVAGRYQPNTCSVDWLRLVQPLLIWMTGLKPADVLPLVLHIPWEVKSSTCVQPRDVIHRVTRSLSSRLSPVLISMTWSSVSADDVTGKLCTINNIRVALPLVFQKLDPIPLSLSGNLVKLIAQMQARLHRSSWFWC